MKTLNMTFALLSIQHLQLNPKDYNKEYYLQRFPRNKM